jgi:hypothetical protein
VILAAVCKSQVHSWNDADIIEFFNFRPKLLLAGDLDDNHPFWNSIVSNPSGMKLVNLLHISEFEISTPQHPTYYSPAGISVMFDIVVHKNFRSSVPFLKSKIA